MNALKIHSTKYKQFKPKKHKKKESYPKKETIVGYKNKKQNRLQDTNCYKRHRTL